MKETEVIPAIDEKKIGEFCKKNGIKKLSLFGSAISREIDESNYIDILVEFFEDSIPGMIGMAGMERHLSEIYGKKVDLRTKDELSRYFREQVLSQAEVMYGY
jgi:uncharacterized protein